MLHCTVLQQHGVKKCGTDSGTFKTFQQIFTVIPDVVYGKFRVFSGGCPSCILYRIKKENAMCILVVDNPVIADSCPLGVKEKFLWINWPTTNTCRPKKIFLNVKEKEGCDFDSLFLVPAA